MKTQLSGLLKASVLTACLFTVLPNAFAESSEYPTLAQENDVRVELLTALELQRSVAESLGRDDLVARLDKSIDEVTYASEAEIAPIEGAVDEFRNQADALQQLELAIHDASAGRAPSSGKPSFSTMAQYSNTTNSVIPSSTSLTGPDYYTGILCIGDFENGVRNDTDVILAANIALSVAKVAWSAAEVLCGLDAVALASGGVGTIICSAAAALVGTAEELLEGLNRCDATVDEAHLDAAFNRAEDNFELNTHIHSDLSDIEADLASHDADINLQISTHDTDINTQISTHDTDIKSQVTTHDTDIKSQVSTHDTEIKSQVSTHDTEIKSQVATHDTDIKIQVATHDTDLKAQLAQHDADVKARLGEIQGTVDENQRLIVISMARQAEILRLLITPSGKREINPDVLSCTGDDCPQADIVLSCENGLDWPCK